MSMTTRSAAVEIADLRVSYGDHVVLDGLDLSIAEGTVLAMLGPNGAGKTTTVNVLSTLLRADSGKATVCGHDIAAHPAAVRSVIGVTGQFSAVDGLLTGTENLLLMGDLHHLPGAESRSRAAALLERFDVADAAGERVANWSGGMQRKLDLAMTLMGEPRVIFLDEPTTGLDPRSRRGLWDLVRGLVADGVTILLTTQYLDEATASPTPSQCSTAAGSSPRAHRRSSSGRCRGVRSCSTSTRRPGSTGPHTPSPRQRATRSR